MGRDKALLPFGEGTLVEHVANRVHQAAGNVTLLGSKTRYGHLGLPVVEDLIPDCGPLGGLHAALRTTHADWNLLVACDMPDLSVEILQEMLNLAEKSGRLALVPKSNRGWEPLCAVYHRHLLPEVERALNRKLLRMQDFVSAIDAQPWTAPDGLLANVNTPAEWEARR